MDGDIHLIIIAIDDPDHLLVARSAIFFRMTGIRRQRHPDQSPEFTNSKIHMHDIVTDVHLLQLFHRQSHLPQPSTIRTKTILMEPVKDLMIGENTYFQVIIHEPFMHGMINRSKLHMILLQFLPCKNLLQTLILLLTVRQDIQLVTFQEIILQTFRQELEILMIKRLGLYVKGDDSILIICSRSKLHLLEFLGIRDKL